VIIPAEERLARVLLTCIAEPGDERLGRLVDQEGAQDAIEAVRAGAVPDGPDRVELEKRFPPG
jgi:hypothetical protein